MLPAPWPTEKWRRSPHEDGLPSRITSTSSASCVNCPRLGLTTKNVAVTPYSSARPGGGGADKVTSRPPRRSTANDRFNVSPPTVCPWRGHLGQGSCQSIGSASIFASSSLARLNGRDPKNPRDADSGDGCGDSMATQLPSASMGLSVDASRPHRIATIGCERATSARIAHSVTASHPLPRCDAGLLGRTVSTLFSSSTPRCAHGVRSPQDGCGCPRSAVYSSKMLDRLRGSGRTSGATEKLRPTACPGVG